MRSAGTARETRASRNRWMHAKPRDCTRPACLSKQVDACDALGNPDVAQWEKSHGIRNYTSLPRPERSLIYRYGSVHQAQSSRSKLSFYGRRLSHMGGGLDNTGTSGDTGPVTPRQTSINANDVYQRTDQPWRATYGTVAPAFTQNQGQMGYDQTQPATPLQAAINHGELDTTKLLRHTIKAIKAIQAAAIRPGVLATIT